MEKGFSQLTDHELLEKKNINYKLVNDKMHKDARKETNMINFTDLLFHQRFYSAQIFVPSHHPSVAPASLYANQYIY